MGEPCKVFYGNLCFVCHLTAKEKKLKQCSSCKLVSYCSEAHQRVHWKNHNALCKIIQKVDMILESENIQDNLNWYRYRTNLLLLCELKLGRRLKVYETNMILFPNNCQVCHKKSNLQVCLHCLCINYCSDDHKQADFASHKETCHLFALCRELDLYLGKTTHYPTYFFRKEYFCLLNSINEFIENNLTIEEIEALTTIQERTLVSELITCPLSLLFALTQIEFLYPKNVIIHIVGCSFLETASLKSWEIILHSKPHIVSLDIHFIGPEVQKNNCVNLCSVCKNKISFKYSNKLYHEYSNLSDFQNPDVICSFNCGFHEFENSDKDTWIKTLPLLIQNKKIPLIFTSFTKSEAERDARLLTLINNQLNVNILRNKFSSLRPYRDFENLGIYFNNYYVCAVSNNS